MAVLGVEEVRQRFAATAEGLVFKGTTGADKQWRQSPAGYDLFPNDSTKYAHLAFAVGAPSTEYTFPKQTYRASRGAEDGAMAVTVIGIRWTYRIRADAQVADYDLALQAEAVLMTALQDTSRESLHYHPTRLTRRGVGDGTYQLFDLLITCTHTVAIQ